MTNRSKKEGVSVHSVWRVRKYRKGEIEPYSISDWVKNSLTTDGKERWLNRIVAADEPVGEDPLDSNSKLELRDAGGVQIKTLEGTSSGPDISIDNDDVIIDIEWRDESDDVYEPGEVVPLFPDNTTFAEVSVAFGEKPDTENWTYEVKITVSPDNNILTEGVEVLVEQLVGQSFESFGDESVQMVVRSSDVQGDPCETEGSEVVVMSPESGYPQVEEDNGEHVAVWVFEHTTDTQGTDDWACYRIETEAEGGGTVLLRGGGWVNESPGTQSSNTIRTIEYELEIVG